MNHLLADIGASTTDMETAAAERAATERASSRAQVERAHRTDRERARAMRRLSSDELWERCRATVDGMTRLRLDAQERLDLIADLVTDRLEWTAKVSPAESVGRIAAKRATSPGRSVTAYLLAVERAMAVSTRAESRMLLAGERLAVTDRDAAPVILARRLADLLSRSGRWRTVERARVGGNENGRTVAGDAHETVGADVTDAPAAGRKRGALLSDDSGDSDGAPSAWTRLLAIGGHDAPAPGSSADARDIAGAVADAVGWRTVDPNAYALLRGALDYWRPVRGRETDWAIDCSALGRALDVSPDTAQKRVSRGRAALLAATAVERVTVELFGGRASVETVRERDPREQRSATRELLRGALESADITAPERDPNGPALFAAGRAVERAQDIARADARMRVRPATRDLAPVRLADVPPTAGALLAWLAEWERVPDADLVGPQRPTPNADSYAPRSYAPAVGSRVGSGSDLADPPAGARWHLPRVHYAGAASMDEWRRIRAAGAAMDRRGFDEYAGPDPATADRWRKRAMRAQAAAAAERASRPRDPGRMPNPDAHRPTRADLERKGYAL